MNTLLSNLKAYWPLSEASGVRDSLVGSVPLTDNNTCGTRDGILGRAADFISANSESLQSPSGLISNTASRSISLWFMQDIQDASQRGIASFGNTALDVAPSLDVALTASTQILRFYHGGAYRATSFSPNAGVWYHIVATYDHPNTRFTGYQAGFQAVQATAAASLNNNYVWLGSGYSAYFDGGICEVGLWDRELTAIEVLYLYNRGRGRAYPFDGPPALFNSVKSGKRRRETEN